MREDDLRALLGRVLLRLDPDVGARRFLVRVVDAREALDLAFERLLVQAFDVTARALLDGCRDVHLDERSPLLDELARLPPGLFVWRDRRRDHGRAVTRQPRRNPTDPLDVGVAVLLGEAEPLREMRAHGVAVQVFHDWAALLDRGSDDVRNGRLARPREAGEPEREPAVAAPLRLGVFMGVDVLSHSTP